MSIVLSSRSLPITTVLFDMDRLSHIFFTEYTSEQLVFDVLQIRSVCSHLQPSGYGPDVDLISCCSLSV
jgi:hypothetical protein